MKIGDWYTEQYSGRKQKYHQVLHVDADEIFINEWVFDKKTEEIALIQKQLSIDKSFYRTRIDTEELVALADEEKQRLQSKIRS